jgi:very-short-patch-repair endonuclease
MARWRSNRGIKKALAKKLRRDQTRAERLAWRILRNRRCLGLKFRRQYLIRGFVVDFYCPDLGLALEVDGSVHDSGERRDYDRHRAALLEGLGVHEIRIRNQDVSANAIKRLLRPFAVPPLHKVERGTGGEA